MYLINIQYIIQFDQSVLYLSLQTDAPCHSMCDTLKNPYCSMAMSAEHRSKFAALHRPWWRLYMSEKFSSGTKSHKQTNAIV